ncbi:MAG: HTTM domain-containing protein [Bdellovibrionaceae bacterium]|nr:HTTM domain-containing protein [Pseudobdellovibrionaceae bacterium]
MLNKMISTWDQFWFGPKQLLNLAFMRVLVTITMLHLYFLRSWNLDYFMADGIMPRDLALSSLDEIYRPLWGWFFWPDVLTPWVHGFFVFALLLLVLGIGGRVLMMIAWMIHAGFIYRNFGILFGADIMASVFLFYLSFSNACARLSVLNLWRKRPVLVTSDALSSVMMRMIQFQICIIYAYTGFEKLKGMSWWDGTALWSVFANPQMVYLDYGFLRHVPLVIAVGSFVSILFEIYFPAAMLNRKLKNPWLIVGVLFHLSIGLSMGLMHFSLFMLSTYFLFIETKYLELFVARVQRFVLRVPN